MFSRHGDSTSSVQTQPQQMTDSTEDFRRHQQSVLAGDFRPDDDVAGEGANSTSETGTTPRRHTILLTASVRRVYLENLGIQARLAMDNFVHGLRNVEHDVQKAMNEEPLLIRCVVAAGLVPAAEEEEDDEAAEVAFEALGEPSRIRVAQELVDKRCKLKRRVTADDVIKYVWHRISNFVQRADALTDTELAAGNWAFWSRSPERAAERALRAIERKLVEAHFLEHCFREDDHNHTRRTSLPCCIYIRNRPRVNRLPQRRFDAVALTSNPLKPWQLYDHVEADFEVSFFPCGIVTPHRGTYTAVLACGWSREDIRRAGSRRYYLAKFVHDYYLRKAAPLRDNWEPQVRLEHIYQPLLSCGAFKNTAHKIQSERVYATWHTDMKLLQHLFFPALLNRHQPSPHAPDDDDDDSPPSSRGIPTTPPRAVEGGGAASRSTSAPLFSGSRRCTSAVNAASRIARDSPDTSIGDNPSHVTGSKRLRSLSQGPPDLDYEVDVDEFPDEAHRRSA